MPPSVCKYRMHIIIIVIHDNETMHYLGYGSVRGTYVGVEDIFSFRDKFIFVLLLFLSASCIIKENEL